MAVISITLTNLGVEVLSGIPRLVSLETNIPSTIFYSIDGTVPSVYSQIYLRPILMPTHGTVRLRVLAVSGADSGILDVTFSTDSTDLREPRRSSAILGGGVVVDAYDVANVLTDGYGPDAYGNVSVMVRKSDKELQELDIRYSRTGPNGEGPGTLIAIGYLSSNYERNTSISHEASSPNDDNIYFNPKSLYITMDGRDGYENQIYDAYQIINRPLDGTCDLSRYMSGKLLYGEFPMISGGLVKTHYNYSTGTSVSYYFDTIELRWVKSIQQFNPREVPRSVGLRTQNGPALVFKWIYNKRSGI